MKEEKVLTTVVKYKCEARSSIVTRAQSYLHGEMPNYQRIKVVQASIWNHRIRLVIPKARSMDSFRVCIR